MKTIVTRLGSFPTGTEIADAVTGYALALARARTVDVVDIPFISDEGSHGRVELRIGWLTDTLVVAGESRDDEPFEVDTILEIHAKSRELRGAGSAMVPPPAHSAPRDPREPNWDELI